MALLRWPQDEASRRRLAAEGRPRLLLVDAEGSAPVAIDELEDWMRFPLDPEELSVRTATLLERTGGTALRSPRLELDDDGMLHQGTRWIALPPMEAHLLARLLARPGEVVHRAELVDAVWPSSHPADPRALDGVVKRLRRRVRPLGVRIHTVTAVGFLLDRTGRAGPGQ